MAFSLRIYTALHRLRDLKHSQHGETKVNWFYFCLLTWRGRSPRCWRRSRLSSVARPRGRRRCRHCSWRTSSPPLPFSCWSLLLPPWREWRQMTGDVSTLFWKQLSILTHVYYSVDRIQSHFICHKMFYVISHKAHWHFIIIEDYCKWIKETVGRLWLPLALLVLKWKYSMSTLHLGNV